MPVERFYPGELFEIVNEIERALASEPPSWIPSRQQRITAAFGWVRIIAATCSFFVVGIIYTDFDPGWLYDTFVSSAVNVGVAMGAAVAGMAVLLLVCPAKKRWSLCRAFASPLFTMVALVLGVAAAIGLAALLMHLEIWLFKWLFGRGLVFAVVAVVLYAPVAVVSTFKLLAYLGVQVVMIVNACLRHWFGCGKGTLCCPRWRRWPSQ